MGLAGQQSGQGLHVYGELGAETAADFHGDSLDLGYRNAHQAGGVVADGEVALAAGVDGQAAVVVPHGGAAVGLDITLVHGGGGHTALHDDVGVGETGVEVAHAELEVVGGVGTARGIVLVQHATGARAGSVEGSESLMNQRGVVSHGLPSVHHRRKHLEFDVDQVQGFLGGVSADRGDGGNGVAFVKGLVLGHDVVAQELEVDHRALGQVRSPAGGFHNVGAGDHGADAGRGLGAAGVDGLDAGMGVGAAQHLAVEHAGQVQVGAVASHAGDLVGSVVADRTGPDYLVFLVAGQDHVGRVVQH